MPLVGLLGEDRLVAVLVDDGDFEEDPVTGIAPVPLADRAGKLHWRRRRDFQRPESERTCSPALRDRVGA